MLRACVIDFGDGWEDSLPYAEFSYNNSYQGSIKMSPFEALYGRKCRTPLNWSETGDSKIFGSAILLEAEKKVHQIRDHLKTAQSRQKSYYDGKHRQMDFEIGDHAYLKVTPLKGLKRFHVKGKLAPRFIGPFKVLGRCGNVAYQVELPEHLSEVHDVFHISQLRKCVSPPHKQADYKEVELSPKLTYEQKPVKLQEDSERRTRNKVIKFFRVQWEGHTEEEATWEREDSLREEYPYLFNEQPKSRDEISNKGGRFVTTQDLVPKTFLDYL